jgi:iron complex outermembrane recepter protein
MRGRMWQRCWRILLRRYAYAAISLRTFSYIAVLPCTPTIWLWSLLIALAPIPAFALEPTAKTQLYTIHPGSLRDAIDALVLQGNLQIVYPPTLVAHKMTRGVVGRFTAVEALKRLLIGTDLTPDAVNETSFVLHYASPGEAIAIKTTPQETPKTLESVQVDGSLIANEGIQTATLTYTISAADIQARGFNSIAEALQNSVLATGSVQGPASPLAATMGALPVSLFGLSPQFVLILIDGKPIANFGEIYNGSETFNNLLNLPLSFVDHIDFMPGGSSTIYGSDAMGGVVNIVTRSHLNGGEVSMRTGNFSDGGGANQRGTFAYGRDFGALSVLGAFEFDNASPIWGYQRALTASTNSGPAGANMGPYLISAVEDFGPSAVSPPSYLRNINPPDGCNKSLFRGTTSLFFDGGAAYPYCGSTGVPSLMTFSNQARSYNGMLKLRYASSDHLWFYADTLLDWQRQRWFEIPLTSGDDLAQAGYANFIEDARTTDMLYLYRYFAPEELPGGLTGEMPRQGDLLYQADVGAGGQFGDSNWNWDIYFVRSGDRTSVTKSVLTAGGVNQFLRDVLGPVVGVDPGTGLGMYNINYEKYFRPIVPSQYPGLYRAANEFSNTWIDDTRLTINNTSAFYLPGGAAGFAALIERGGEAWYEPVNLLVNEFNQSNEPGGNFIGSGGGRRSHAASAFQLNLPLFASLTIDLSGRYDRYAFSRNISHQFTEKIGLEYRPVGSLLFRGNYTTNFQAPGLQYISSSPEYSSAYMVDYYQCAVSKSTQCSENYASVVPTISLANPALQPVTAQSWTAGMLWSPTNDLSVSVDYLRIAIHGEVMQQDADALMQEDAQCLLGQLDPHAATCQALTNPINGQVQRAGTKGPVTSITTHFANLSNEATESIIASARYQLAMPGAGTFRVQLDYNDTLKHSYQAAPGQARVNVFGTPSNAEFKSIVSGSLTWMSPNQRWTSTLYGHRYGASPNFPMLVGNPGAGRVPSWITYNWSASYAPTAHVSVSVLINNLFNKMPPSDPTFTPYPYFNSENYNIYGREIMLQAKLVLAH